MTITAIPAASYRVIAGDEGYTVISGTVTVVNNGDNTFSITPQSDCTVQINFEAIPTHTATFSVNGATTSEEYAEGAAITFPANPSDISGKSFVGWSETTISGTTNTPPEFVNSATMGTSDVTFYAVFAEVTPGTATNITDNLTTSTFGSPSSYTTWSGMSANGGSDAVYAGNSTTYNNTAIQIRATSPSGIVSTTSGGRAKKVTVTWNNGTANGRTLDVYGKNTAYTGSANLYDSSVQGTKIGSIVYGTSTELTISTDYMYIGMRSNSNAMYLDQISIEWEAGTPDTYSNYCTTVPEVAVEKPVITVAENPFLFSTTATITCATEGAAIKYSYDGETWNDYSDPFTITETKTIYAKGVKGQDESSVASVTATKNLAEPTVTVSGELTLDLAGGSNVNAGTLTAAVTYNDAAVEGATVTWSSSDDNIATINETTGVVTLIATGEVTFTATYAGNGDYAESTGTKTITVIDSQAPGTENHPYTVAQARAAIDAGTGVTGVYATGIVCTKATSLNSGKLSYYISDDGTESTRLEAYNGYGLNGASFTSIDDVELGATVVIFGNLTKYNSTYEFAANNRLISYTAPAAPNPQTLTVSATNGNVEITGKTLVNGSCEVNEDASVTATATPANHYTFTSWTADGVTLADATVNPLTFTMPSNNVTLTANFTEIAQHTATFNILTSSTNVDVYEGDAITFPNVTAPNGYTFMGWTTSSIDGILDGAPDILVNSADMGNASINYFAVFAIQIGSYEGTVELTNTTIKNNREGKTSYGTYSIGDWSGKFMIAKNGDVYGLQLGYNASSSASAYNSHLTTPECAYNISSITISTNNNTANGRTFYLCSANDLGTASSENATYGSGSITEANGSVTINLSSNTKQFHIYPNGTAYIESVSLIYSNATYSSYCTTITYTSYENEETRETPISANEIVTVQDGAILTLNAINSGTAANLIIEDGGILITHNAVEATVQKNITGVGAENWEEVSGAAGWYFIASPVNGANFNTATTGDYDLYLLDWADNWWRNIKKQENASIFAAGFQRGTGYLYASKDGNTISVAGEIKPLTAADTAQVRLKTTGWNLIGNPLTCKVTVDCPFDELTNASAVITKGAGNIINPCQGIAVWGNVGTTVTFTKAESQNAAAPSNNSIQMTLTQNIVNRGSTNSTMVDNAIISFNKSNGLPKFPMLEGNAKLYIPVNHEQYAIVSCETQGEMPVCFKAVTDGQYTISVKPEGVEVSYLHLIDNIAGTDIDLLATPSYTFNAKGDDYESRFRLVFSANSGNESGNANDNFAFFSNGELIINGTGTLQVFDVLGRNVFSKEDLPLNSHLSTLTFKAGVYVLRLINGTDVKTQKMVIR